MLIREASSASTQNATRQSANGSHTVNNANNTSSIIAPKGGTASTQKSDNTRTADYYRHRHLCSDLRNYSDNKATRKNPPPYCKTTQPLSPAHNVYKGNPPPVSTRLPKKNTDLGVKRAEPSVKTKKIVADTPDVRTKEAKLRNPQSQERKSFRQQSTKQFLDHHFADGPLFSSYNATPTTLTTGDLKPVRVKPQQTNPRIDQHAVSDFDLDQYPLLTANATDPEPLRMKRSIGSGYDTLPRPSQTESDEREHFSMPEPGDGILPGDPEPAIDTTEAETLTPSLPVSVGNPGKLFHVRPLTDFFVYEAVFLLTLEKVHGISRQEAQQAYAELNTDMYTSWRNVTSAGEIEAIWAQHFVFDRNMAMALHDIMDWLGDDAWSLYTEADHDGAINLGIAKGITQYHERNFADYVDQSVQIYWEMLDRRNLAAIDPRRIRWEGLVNFNIWKAVCAGLKEPVDVQQFFDRKSGYNYNILIDQAALIAHTVEMIKVQMDAVSQTPPPPSLSSYQDIQNKYVQGLLNDLQDKTIGQKLIPLTSFPLAYAKITCRAGAINGAIGLNADGIARALFESTYRAENPEVMRMLEQMPGVLPDKFATDMDALRNQFAHPLSPSLPERYARRPDTVQIDDVWLTLPELTDIIKKMMIDWKIDTKYPIGSPHHSSATINPLEGPSHRMSVCDTNNLAPMVRDLIRLDAEWFENSQNAFTPSLLAALHRATCLGIPLLNMDTGETREQRTVKLVEQRFVPLFADEDLRLWLHNFLPSLNYAGQPYHQSAPDEILPFMSAINKYYSDCMSASEFINYDSEGDLVKTLQEAFNDALKGYQKPPAYNRDTEIRRQLQGRLGMTEAETKTPRWVTVGLPGIFRRDVPRYISPLEEYKLKNRLEPHGITFKQRSINDVMSAAKEIEPEFRALLYKNPAVRARVLESLRMSGVTFVKKNVDDLLELSVTQIIGIPPESQVGVWYTTLKNYFVGTSIRHLLIEGLSMKQAAKEVVELVPFLEGTIEVVEGIATLNGTEVTKGALSLGEDAIGILMLGVFEGLVRKGIVKVVDAAPWKLIFSKNALRMSSVDAAKVEMLKEASIHFPEFAGDLTLSKRKLIINDDAHNVKMHRFVDSSSFNERAARVLNGEKNINFVTPTKEVLPLVESGDGRVVVVRPDIFCMIPCDFSGNPIRDARPIFRMDTVSNRMGASEGLPGGSASLSASEISERPSVKPLVDYLNKIKATRGLNDWDSDFLSVFYSTFKFENPAHAEASEFIKNMEMFYKGSPLMRAVLTNSIKKNKGKLIKVVFDAERARADGDTIYFINAAELKKIHYMTERGPKSISQRQMHLHEPMHLLTSLEDVPRSLARQHRGPNVVLSDEIERQASQVLIDKRLCYEKAFLGKLHGQVNTVAEQTNGIGRLVDYMNAEDNYLSSIFEDVAKPFGHPDVLRSIATPRVTILEMQKFDTLLEQNLGRGQWPIVSMLRTQLDGMTAAAETDQIRALIADVRKPLMQNKRFNDMHLLWIETHHATPLKLQFAPLVQGAGPLKAFKIERGSTTTNLVINSNPVYFFNKHGTELMSDKRKLLGAFIELYYPEELVVIAPSYITEPYHDRTLRVIFENWLMETGVIEKPLPRICKALTASADGWLPHRSGVTQMAKDEDRVLHAMGLPS
ncbi:hypothetical protein [Glaciimonas sp. GG7]